MALSTILTILFFHFAADFVFQTSWMAQNKKHNLEALSAHIIVYTLVFCIIDPLYGIINGIIHYGVDFITSRVAAKYLSRQDYRSFFLIIGVDQLIHYFCLLTTGYYLLR